MSEMNVQFFSYLHLHTVRKSRINHTPEIKSEVCTYLPNVCWSDQLSLHSGDWPRLAVDDLSIFLISHRGPGTWLSQLRSSTKITEANKLETGVFVINQTVTIAAMFR